MSYNSIFDSSSTEVSDFNDTASSSSLETVIFNPTIDIRTFQRSGSWSPFPPPHTPSPEIIAQTHDPLREVEELAPLGSEPRDPTLRIHTSDLIDTVTFIENTPPAYTRHPIRSLEAHSLRQSPIEDARRRSMQFSTLGREDSPYPSLDGLGIISLGQRIAQEVRAQRNRRVHFGTATSYNPPPPMAWPDSSASIISNLPSDDEEEEEEEPESLSSWILQGGEAEDNRWRRSQRQRHKRYHPEPSFVERLQKDFKETCTVCYGACAVM